MTWNEAQIHDFFDALRAYRADATLVEVMSAATGVPDTAARTICAFANMPDGGTLLLGIDAVAGRTVDTASGNTGATGATEIAVVGVTDPMALAATVLEQARTTVVPTPYVSTYSIVVDGKQVVVVEVTPLRLSEKPAMHQGKAYLRQSDGDFVMQEHELRVIEAEQTLLTSAADYDLQPATGLTGADLVPELVAQYVTAVRTRDRRLTDRSDDEILRRTGVMTAQGAPTLAGLYAMGDFPQGYYPGLGVTAAVRLAPNDRGERTRDLRHLTGPVPVLLEELMAWCEQNISATRFYRADGHMGERPELPLSAIRELLANALVHRDLSSNTLGLGKQLHVRLTPQALIVTSPGGLRGVSLAQLKSDDHAQAAVNQRLYGISQKLRTADGSFVTEGEGGGIREVFRAATEYALPMPALVNTGVQFKATLWRPVETPGAAASVTAPGGARFAASMTDPDRTPQRRAKPRAGRNDVAILAELETRGDVTVQELQAALGLSVGQVRYSLNKALETGVVEMVGGQGQTTVYRLTT